VHEASVQQDGVNGEILSPPQLPHLCAAVRGQSESSPIPRARRIRERRLFAAMEGLA
jgi:hypothetical protein